MSHALNNNKTLSFGFYLNTLLVLQQSCDLNDQLAKCSTNGRGANDLKMRGNIKAAVD